MTREELLAMIYEDNTLRSCPTEETRCGLEDAEINTQEYCKKCAENLLTEYENKIRADERTKVLTQFLFELGKNVAYEKEKVFGTDVIRVDALMTICNEIEEQLKEQSNEV